MPLETYTTLPFSDSVRNFLFFLFQRMVEPGVSGEGKVPLGKEIPSLVHPSHFEVVGLIILLSCF